jgi:hypothetical protein
LKVTCTGVAIATAVVGGVITTTNAQNKGRSWGRSSAEGTLDVGLGLSGARKIEAIRWFGSGRNYRTLAMALSKGAGRNRGRTLGKDFAKDQVRGAAINWGWGRMNKVWR